VFLQVDIKKPTRSAAWHVIAADYEL